MSDRQELRELGLHGGDGVCEFLQQNNVAVQIAEQRSLSGPFGAGDQVIMYGGLVGTASQAIRQGDLLSTRNIRHAASDFHASTETFHWTPPDVGAWRERTFLGYYRSDGQVGTRNYWLVIPLVFCENRNLAVLKQAFEEELGFQAGCPIHVILRRPHSRWLVCS